MAVLTDVTFYMGQSPRLLLVDSSVLTDITAQDIVDTIRDYEQLINQVDDPHMLDASGKQPLFGGAVVASTLVLRDLKIAFSPRTAPDTEGTATSADSLGRVLVDTAATFVSDGIEPGAIVWNDTDGSASAVLRVDSQNQLVHWPLEGGTDDEWGIGDSYRIWNVIVCTVSGGNVSAKDSAGADMHPFLATFATQINFAASSSGTIADITDVRDNVVRLLGLSHENSFLDNAAYVNGRLESGRLRIFNSRVNAEAATAGGNETEGLISTYRIAASHNVAGLLESYLMVLSS